VIDLGDGVAAIELHSKMNALGDDIVNLITQTLKPSGEIVNNFEAFVVTGDSANFSVGANLMQLLLGIQEEEWDEVEMAVRAFPEYDAGDQVLPTARGGRSVWHVSGRRHGDRACTRRRDSLTQSFIWGLVEAGVGLIPGGGGCKEIDDSQRGSRGRASGPMRGARGGRDIRGIEEEFRGRLRWRRSRPVPQRLARLGFSNRRIPSPSIRERLLTDAKSRGAGDCRCRLQRSDTARRHCGRRERSVLATAEARRLDHARRPVHLRS